MMEELLYPEEVKELQVQRNILVEKTPKNYSKLSLNCIMCLHCNDIIVAPANHDLIKCKCGVVAIGGAKDYTRRIGIKDKDYEELSIWKP